ncbi:hypothetical protein K8R30_02770 [archaeon]|nr:hypothetical protein [archaeon]
MNDQIKKMEENLDRIQEIIFDLRKFFQKNPEIATRYEEFSKTKEKLLY